MFGRFKKKPAPPQTTAVHSPQSAAVPNPPPAPEAMSPNKSVAPAETLPVQPSPDSSASVSIPAEELSPERLEQIKETIIEKVRTVFDPEIPVNIYELGLIYNIDVQSTGSAHIRMTLTSPNCPSAEELPVEVHYKVKQIEGVKDVKVSVVWDPPWDPTKMTEAARLQLGMF